MDCLLFLNSQAMKKAKEKWKSRMNGKRTEKQFAEQWNREVVKHSKPKNSLVRDFPAVVSQNRKNLFYWLVFFLQLKDVRVVKLERKNRAKSEENALRHLPRCFESSTLKLICANSACHGEAEKGEIGRNLLPFDYFESLLRFPNCQKISASIPNPASTSDKTENYSCFRCETFFSFSLVRQYTRTGGSRGSRKKNLIKNFFMWFEYEIFLRKRKKPTKVKEKFHFSPFWKQKMCLPFIMSASEFVLRL